MNGAGFVRFEDPAWLHAVWAGPVALLVAAWSIRGSARAMRRFADEPMLGALTRSVRGWARWLKAALVALALSAAALAVARPQGDPEPIESEQRGRDVVFVVDVSRSMLATDLVPNRLERSKLWIKDLAGSLEGDRVGLVVFAGAAVVKCPLTLDRAFFDLALDELTPRSAPVGGTFIGDAIRKTVDDVFEVDPDAAQGEGGPITRDIVLITDGEDQDSFPVDAAAAAGRAGVRIIAIGVGDAGDGSLVPDPESGGSVMYAGSPVRSRLDAATLSEIAAASAGGAMLNVGTGTIRLEEVYRDLTDPRALRMTGTTRAMRYKERFQIPLALAVALLTLESLIGERRRSRA